MTTEKTPALFQGAIVDAETVLKLEVHRYTVAEILGAPETEARAIPVALSTPTRLGLISEREWVRATSAMP
jgi:hypothetical protein